MPATRGRMNSSRCHKWLETGVDTKNKQTEVKVRGAAHLARGKTDIGSPSENADTLTNEYTICSIINRAVITE